MASAFAATEHPRVCGENSGYMRSDFAGVGTSPRMRGKPFEPKAAHSTSRNIPAYAGKSVAPGVRHTGGGTSPRMRGKLGVGAAHATAVRNIPAYAGKTPMIKSSPPLRAEHPRVCGENPLKKSQSRNSNGTSPRMRGKREQTLRSGKTHWNIPAYAGKTSNPRSPLETAEHPRVCGENLTRMRL